MPKPLPTDTSTFRDIIQGGYLYVDKTEYIYKFVARAKGAYFLSRPRRFGKSLLISTLDELFRGNRELFQGLWIDQSDYKWDSYPVIRLDFNQEPTQDAESLQDSINAYLDEIAESYNIELADGPYYRRFRRLIQTLAKNKPVVILIDEYDKPLIENLENLDDPEKLKNAQEIRDTLKGFYGVIKAMDRHIRLAFITGISKVGVFSDLNNLTDLTLTPSFATALGLTETELRENLSDYISIFAEKKGVDIDTLLDEIRHWYDGFCFAHDGENVYNPFSTMLLFFHQRFSNYWFESGTPTFLINLLRDNQYDIEELGTFELEDIAFSTYELERLAIVPLLFQTGYLTIKGYNEQTRLFKLYYPNFEVENAFLIYLLDAFSNIQQGLTTSYLGRLITALEQHDLDEFFKVLKVLFANIDYDLQLNHEKYYQTIFYLTFTLVGLRTAAEVKTNDGRIDAVIELSDRIYLFEFKLDKNATEAMNQIQSHRYYEKYQLRGKPITCVGANFSTSTRTVGEWTTQEMGD